ncbi:MULTISPECIES: septal ring lytic transglycosylase RlpA family protein [Cyanophyceae]|uniref:septal ring lytic transglycosylase RlpA family protein n=1 Tax=Cyanophyceae TaxID=3028117 RepID=UPI00118144C1|nr:MULTISPECIES: septal ring lytic transglycosylase RlpA family protein [Cyanophyceae]
MHLPKFTGLLSTLGASLVMGLGAAAVNLAPFQTKAIATSADPAKTVSLNAQRETLAENPLCRLASTLDKAPEAQLVADTNPEQLTPQVSKWWAFNLFQRFTQSLGLDSLLQLEVPLATAPLVAVVPTPEAIPQAAAESGAQLISYDTDRPATNPQSHQLWLQNKPVATIRSQQEAERLAQRLEQLVAMAEFQATAIAPTLHEDKPAIAFGDDILLVVDETITHEDVLNHEILAIQWANNLRLALGVPALDMVTAQQQMYQLEETGQSLEGLASWYGPYFHGRLTANGETYDQYALTAAHPSMPLNTYLKVTNLNNDRSVIIRLNDRGPYIPPRSLDLSLGAARCLNSVETGVIPYKATIMEQKSPEPEAIAPDMI